MRKNLFRVFLVTVLGFVWIGAAEASLTRLQSMGANGNGLSLGKSGEFIEGVVAIDDSTNIFSLPGTLALYPSLAIMDGISWSDTEGATGMFGFHYALGEYTVMALYGGQGTSSLASSTGPTRAGAASASNAAGASAGDIAIPSEFGEQNQPNLTGDLWFGLLFAHNLGGIRLGGGIHTYSASTEVVLPELQVGETSNWAIDLDLGLGLDFDTEDSLDFGLGFRFGSFDYTGPISEQPGVPIAFYTPYTNIGVDFVGRGKFALYEGAELIPYAQLVYDIEGVTDEFPLVDTGVQPFGDSSHFGFELGMDLKLSPTDKIFIYPGFGLRMDTYSVSNLGGTVEDNSRFTLPFYGFGVDARVWKWFAFRFGARQYVHMDTDGSIVDVTDEDGGAGVLESSAEQRRITTDLNMGFGLFFGENDEWQIDAHMSPAFFVKGPHFLTGATTVTEDGTEQMNASVALQYIW